MFQNLMPFTSKNVNIIRGRQTNKKGNQTDTCKGLTQQKRLSQQKKPAAGLTPVTSCTYIITFGPGNGKQCRVEAPDDHKS